MPQTAQTAGDGLISALPMIGLLANRGRFSSYKAALCLLLIPSSLTASIFFPAAGLNQNRCPSYSLWGLFKETVSDSFQATGLMRSVSCSADLQKCRQYSIFQFVYCMFFFICSVPHPYKSSFNDEARFHTDLFRVYKTCGSTIVPTAVWRCDDLYPLALIQDRFQKEKWYLYSWNWFHVVNA